VSAVWEPPLPGLLREQLRGPEVDTLSGLQGSADVIVAVVIAERNVAVDDWTRVVLGAVREIADVVVHVGDDGLMPDLLSTLGEVDP